jgi:hypothetical protein
VEPLGVVAGGDQQRAGRVGADPEGLDQPWRGGGGQLRELGVEARDLRLERLAAARELSERELAGGQRTAKESGAEPGCDLDGACAFFCVSVGG